MHGLFNSIRYFAKQPGKDSGNLLTLENTEAIELESVTLRAICV
jgi:hypothetical protein